MSVFAAVKRASPRRYVRCSTPVKCPSLPARQLSTMSRFRARTFDHIHGDPAVSPRRSRPHVARDRRACPLAIIVLVGVHPSLMQVPPACSRSMSAVFRPAPAKAVASGPPACPAPTMITSYCSAMCASSLPLCCCVRPPVIAPIETAKSYKPGTRNTSLSVPRFCARPGTSSTSKTVRNARRNAGPRKRIAVGTGAEFRVAVIIAEAHERCRDPHAGIAAMAPRRDRRRERGRESARAAARGSPWREHGCRARRPCARSLPQYTFPGAQAVAGRRVTGTARSTSGTPRSRSNGCGAVPAAQITICAATVCPPSSNTRSRVAPITRFPVSKRIPRRAIAQRAPSIETGVELVHQARLRREQHEAQAARGRGHIPAADGVRGSPRGRKSVPRLLGHPRQSRR